MLIEEIRTSVNAGLLEVHLHVEGTDVQLAIPVIGVGQLLLEPNGTPTVIHVKLTPVELEVVLAAARETGRRR